MKDTKKVYTNLAPEPIGPYSQAVWAKDMLFLSGQIAMDKLDCDIKTQTEIVCKNIEQILKSANLKLANVVKTTCFLKKMGDFESFNQVYANYFSHKPARSCVAVKKLPKDALIEIEIIAVKD